MVKISEDNLAGRIDYKKAGDNKSKEPDKGFITIYPRNE